MKLPLIAVCVLAGSTWSYSSAGDTAAVNPRTTSRPFPARAHVPGQTGKSAYTSHTAPPWSSGPHSTSAPANPSALPAIVASGNSDDCSTAKAITGAGPFAFDNTAATTGPQQGLGCGTGTCNNDVWFQWTATATGTCVFSLCSGGAAFDTLIAVYSGAGCPGGGALGCNDDSCGLVSQMLFPVTAGSAYMLQIGAYSAAGAGTGTFTMAILPPPTNDDCSTPIALGPTGPYAFNQLGATTGAQGQAEPLCLFYGMTAIENDVWYTWTAPTTGRAEITLCGLATVDSKVAVYDGAGCPASTAIGCNDDACGLQSEICFPITAGQTYTIQLGTFPGAAAGSGSFDILLVPALPPCTYDDGSTENILGWTAGGDLVWLNRFGSVGVTTTLSSVEVAWGSALFAGFNPGNGTPSDIFVWQDGPTQDGDPSDATLLLQIPTTVSNVDTDTFVTYTFAPLNISGIFFVGSHQDSYGLSGAGPAQYVAPLDQNCPFPGVAWFFGNDSGFGTSPVNYGSPGANVQPPVRFDSIGLAGQVMVRAGCLSVGPANDDPCSVNLPALPSETSVSGPFPVNATLATPNASTLPPSGTSTCAPDGLWEDLWYKWSPVGDGQNINTYTFSLCSTSGFKPVINIYEDLNPCPGSIVQCANQCSTSIPGSTPPSNGYTNVCFTAIQGHNYVVQIGRTGSSPWTSTQSLSITRSSGPCTTGIVRCEPGVSGVAPCPCGNAPSGLSRGCDNSSNTGGASMTATGNPSIGADTVVFTTSNQKPTGTSVLLQGTTLIPGGAVFGQGVRCVGGVLKRLYIKSAVGGSISAPVGVDPTVTVRSAALGDLITAGSTRHYMVYYRDPIVLGGCPATSTFNATNSLELLWTP